MQEHSSPLKRKKKRSLVQSVKKKFKNGNVVAHGSNLDQDTYNYFLRVFEQSRQEFGSEEEKRIFVENVFAQTVGHEVEYSKNQLVSRVLENLLPLTSDKTFERFISAFSDDLRAVCVNNFASFVIEKMICVCTNRVHEIIGSSDESSSTYQTSGSFEFVMKLSKYLANNLDEFVLNNFANHVIKATISCLANLLPVNQREKGKNSKFTFNFNPTEKELELEKINKQSEFHPPEFVEILVDIAKRVLNSPSFVDFPRDTLMSTLLQTILFSLYAVKKKGVMKSISKKLISTTYIGDPNTNQLPEILKSQPPVRLLETVLDVSNKKRFWKIYEQCFAGRLAMLAKGRSSSFTFGKLVQRCDDKEKFLQMYAEISDGDTLREIARSPAAVLLATIANACRRLNAMQNAFIKDISKALDVKSSGLVPALLNLDVKSATSTYNRTAVGFAGCVILQEILRFKKRKKIVKGLLAMANEELVSLFSDSRGSHIADAFFASDSCTGGDMEMMINKLQGSFVELATSKHGSYALTSFWKLCPPLSLKIKVVEELAHSSLANNISGRVISNQFGLETYLHQRSLWEKVQENLEKARKEFDAL